MALTVLVLKTQEDTLATSLKTMVKNGVMYCYTRKRNY